VLGFPASAHDAAMAEVVLFVTPNRTVIDAE
jgi:hypothetical protein